jgi:hypothetical protein
MSKELIVIEETNLPQLFTENGCDPLLERIKAEVSGHEPDLSTVKGRDDIRSLAHKVSQSKAVIEKAGKKFVSKIKEQTKSIDAERKRVRDELDLLRVETRQPLTNWEAEEEKRLLGEQIALEIETSHVEALAENDLFDRQREIERKEAIFARQEEERIEKELVAKAERDRIEAEKQAEVDRVARDKRIADEAAETARREGEEKLQEAHRKTEQARRDVIAGEERAKLETERAESQKQQAVVDERERVERETAEREEAKRREEEQKQREADKIAANKNHQKQVNRKMVSDFAANGIDEESARMVIRLVVSGKINGMTVNY